MTGTRSLLLLAFAVGCSDKGDDSSGGGDEADADADTDADTDTDTDVDTEKYLEGTVHVIVKDATDTKTLCDTNVDLTGEESAGACLNCDFTIDIDPTLASEAGTDCDYDNRAFSTLLEGSIINDTWLGFTESYTTPYATYSNLIWFGAGYPGYPGPYWNSVIAYDDGVTYAGGLLEWSTTYNTYGNNLYLTYCGAYAYTGGYPGGGSPNYGGSYTAAGSLDCSLYTPYESFTFQGVDDDFAYVSVDTVSDASTFDPFFYISASDTCWTAYGDESFDCSFPPAQYMCPSVKMPTEKGETYTLTVMAYSQCDNATADFTVYVDTKGDPSLAQLAVGELTPLTSRVSVEGSATITEQKEE